MKFKLAEIKLMEDGLKAITKQPLPVKLSFRLSKLLNFCGQELQQMEEARVKLVKELSVPNPDEEGGLIVPPENIEKFREEFNTLLSEEVEFNFTPIKISELGEDLKITPSEILSLSKIIQEEE
jgi:hypothetical protein